MTANVTGDELALIFYLIAAAALGGAAYLAYLRNALGALLLIVVAIVAVIIGSD